jgi:hypothetical protein
MDVGFDIVRFSYVWRLDCPVQSGVFLPLSVASFRFEPLQNISKRDCLFITAAFRVSVVVCTESLCTGNVLTPDLPVLVGMTEKTSRLIHTVNYIA